MAAYKFKSRDIPTEGCQNLPNSTAETAWPADKVERRPIADLIPYARNARTHSDAQVAQIAASITEWGWTTPVLVDETGSIIAGHGRVMAARKLGLSDVPVMVAAGWTEGQKRAYVLADNKLALNAGWDDVLLASELVALGEDGFNLNLVGFSDQELSLLMGQEPDNAGGDSPKGSLADRFLIPPFSVLNAREGWWQDRKRAWLALGIKSELGRGDNGMGAPGGGAMPATDYKKTGARGDGAGRSKFGKAFGNGLTSGTGSYDAAKKAASKGGFGKCLETGIGEKYGREEMNATSIFDPVMCEIAYTWFCPPSGTILDPFAGGSVRGVVASQLGRQYIGHELRGEQVAANRLQGEEICKDPMPVWIEGDSRLIDKTCADVEADMVFSCPPYADLEVYSDDPADLSNMPYSDFRAAYRDIIAKACGRLKRDRFAAFIVGEVRDKKGLYVDFVGDTVQAFRDAGLAYYNEAILVTAVGSLPIRAGKQFAASRKLGKTHQNVLVFVKGDPKKAAEACGLVEVHVPEEVDNAAA